MLQCSDGEAADQIDQNDDNAGDDVAFDEFHGTVHRAEQLALVLELQR